MSEHWDEIASAHLDGEATPDEATRLAGDPDALAAFETMQGVASANASVPTAPPGLQALHLDAALSLFDELERTPSPTSNVVPLRRRRAATWLATAAAGIIVLAGVGLGISRLDSSATDDETADAAASPSANAELRAADAEEADDSPMEESTGEAMASTAASDSPASDGGAADSAAADSGEPESSATTLASSQPFVDAVPVAELTAADDLFVVAQSLIDDEQLSANPTTAAGQALAILQVRCPAAFDTFTQPVAAPILFDGALATLVVSTSPPDHAMVITRECAILFADQRP